MITYVRKQDDTVEAGRFNRSNGHMYVTHNQSILHP